MDSTPDPERPPVGKPKYLPRLTYKPEPPPAEAPDPEVKSSSPPKAVKGSQAEKRDPVSKPKKKPREGDSEKKTVLIEETPELDTIESRKKVRLLVGGALVGILALVGFLISRAFRSDEPNTGVAETSKPAGSGTVKPTPSPAMQESLAKKILADAKQFERGGQAERALELILSILSEYPSTPSAKIAAEARDRQQKGLPLFVDGAAVVAEKVTPVKPPEPPSEGPDAGEASSSREVVVVGPRPTSPSVTPGGGTIEVVANPGGTPPRMEPRRPTGVGLPRSEVAARPLPAGFRARTEAGVHASGWPLEITSDRDGGTLVLIPGGTFPRGRDDGRLEERPAHKVALNSYYIDQHEITNRQYKSFKSDHPKLDDLPVVNVSLGDARLYAQWAGASLPTEAQWEAAGRTTDGRLRPWGNSPAEWDRPRQPKQIDPVMSFGNDLSPYGVFDLAGNAWEWTNDWFDIKAYMPFKTVVANNPTGPSKGKGKIPEVTVKGGSKDWDSSWRMGMRPEARLPYLGFRLVLNVEGGGIAAPPPGQEPATGPRGGVPF